MDITHIYLVTNCFNDTNKVYIGKTKNNRKSSHKKTYGKNITYTEIDSVNSHKYKDWEPLETYWIEQFKAWGFEVVNKRQKGGSGSEYCTKETKTKISIGNTGKTRTQLMKEILSLKLSGRPKSEVTKTNMRKPKCSSSNMRKPKTTSKKGLEHKTYGTKKPVGFGEKLSQQRTGKPLPEGTGKKISKAKSRSIEQYDLGGNFIKEWPSIKEAKKYHNGDIQGCCSGIQKTAGGYIWKYKD